MVLKLNKDEKLVRDRADYYHKMYLKHQVAKNARSKAYYHANKAHVRKLQKLRNAVIKEQKALAKKKRQEVTTQINNEARLEKLKKAHRGHIMKRHLITQEVARQRLQAIRQQAEDEFNKEFTA